MASISEEISQQSAELLLRVLGAFVQLGVSSAQAVFEVTNDGATTLVNLMDFLQRNYPEYDLKTRMAVNKLREACEKEKAAALMATAKNEDVPEIDKWLKKQGALYVGACPSRKKGTPAEQLDIASKGKYDQTTFFFMDKDKEKVENAFAICAYKRNYINVLPPAAFFLLYDDKKDISVVDGLDQIELRVFRELAQKHGLGYTEMLNGEDSDKDSIPGTYKVVCAKEDADKMRSIMRMVTWSITGESSKPIKEKVLERESILAELKKLIEEGVKDGAQIFIDESANRITVENAKYIVNALRSNQYIKVSAKGFSVFKGSGEGLFVAKSDPDYEEKLEDAMAEFQDAVIFDSVEWEKGRLDKGNLRENAVARKLSVFPPEMSLEKEEVDLRRAHKKRLERSGPWEESVWLFHKYDPDKPEAVSEVVEQHYGNPHKPLEETVSIHYNAAVRRSERYRYYDIESNEQSVDKIILAAKEHSLGNKDYGKDEGKAMD